MTYDDSKIKQCYISTKLEDELKEWYNLFNSLSLEKTSYVIKPGNPTSSEICAAILKAVRTKLKVSDFILKDTTKRAFKELNISRDLNIVLNLNVELSKIKGIKKNDIEIVTE